MLRTLPALLLCLAVATPATAAGFRQIVIPDPGNPPIAANIWYPSSVPPRLLHLGLRVQAVAMDAPMAGTGLGLIAISHGTGGGADNHFDTAEALADAGFVVVAPTHTGDNLADRSRTLQIWDRPRQLHRVLDYMLHDWDGHARINPQRVGAFGFSAGGFTVLVAAGGTPDLARIGPHCKAQPTDWTCQMIAAHTPPHVSTPAAASPTAPPPPPAWVHDADIHAIIVAAPALGYTFGKSGLAGIKIPVQLWRAADDHILPQPFYAQAVADDLPNPPDYHVVENAGHLDFMAPCSPDLAKVAPEICTSNPNFNRAAFHQQFNKAAVAFFQKTLF